MHLAFQWWSIPLFALPAACALVIVTSVSAPLPTWGKRLLRRVALRLVSSLTSAWWVSQGNPNCIGSMLYGYAVVAVAIVAGVLCGFGSSAETTSVDRVGRQGR